MWQFIVGIALVVLIVGFLVVAWKHPRLSQQTTANEMWIDATPGHDTDKPGINPAHKVNRGVDEVATTVQAAVSHEQAQAALPDSDERERTSSSSRKSRWDGLSFFSKAAVITLGAWACVSLVSALGGWSISTPKPKPLVSTQATPTPPPKMSVKRGSSAKEKAKARTKTKKAQREYRQKLRELRAQKGQRLRIPLWIPVFVVPILLTALITAVVWELGQAARRRRQTATQADD